MESQFNRAVSRVHETLQGRNVPWHYVWLSTVVGADSPAMTLVLPYMNWAGMAPRDPTMEQIVFEAVRPDEGMDMFNSFGEAVISTTSAVLRLRPDLSVSGGM